MSIFITGIAGTLGKAFTRLLSEENVVIGCDTNEWAVAEFMEEFPEVNISLRDFGNWTYEQNQCCDTIIHCAAFKHLPLGEQNVWPFVENNILKTKRMLEKAKGYGVDVIFISSDKAVEPISLYGMTKAIGEYLTRESGGYIARCGNFLGSSGSVIPVWEKAIREGKPIKITDRRMKRFVIDPNDAARQIWDGYLKRERLIIPKCKEMSIMSLLRSRKYSTKVKFTGIRRGEKLREKLRWDWEK